MPPSRGRAVAAAALVAPDVVDAGVAMVAEHVAMFRSCCSWDRYSVAAISRASRPAEKCRSISASRGDNGFCGTSRRGPPHRVDKVRAGASFNLTQTCPGKPSTSPSPSGSPSGSSSPSDSVSPSTGSTLSTEPTAGPSGPLPRTGAPIGSIVLGRRDRGRGCAA
jgi:hypothetical protein